MEPTRRDRVGTLYGKVISVSVPYAPDLHQESSSTTRDERDKYNFLQGKALCAHVLV